MPQNSLEQTRLKERIKELKILFIFVLGSAAVSIIIMNLIAFPVAIFAVKNKALFTVVVKIALISIILGYIIFRIYRRISISQREDIPFSEAMAGSVKRKLQSTASIAVGAGLFTIIAIILYLVLSYNYQIIYNLMR